MSFFKLYLVMISLVISITPFLINLTKQQNLSGGFKQVRTWNGCRGKCRDLQYILYTTSDK